MTLVELVVAMVIIGVALAGVLSVFSSTSTASTDPMVTKQMTAIAEGMMEEIQRMPFTPASNVILPNDCTRNLFNGVEHYDKYQCADATDVTGATIPGLAGYSIYVTVRKVNTGPMAVAVATDTLQINVQVTRGSRTFILQGWRTNFGKFQ